MGGPSPFPRPHGGRGFPSYRHFVVPAHVVQIGRPVRRAAFEKKKEGACLEMRRVVFGDEARAVHDCQADAKKDVTARLVRKDDASAVGVVASAFDDVDVGLGTAVAAPGEQVLHRDEPAEAAVHD